MTNFEMVASFQEKFGFTYEGKPRILPLEDLLRRLNHVSEEFHELETAVMQDNVEEYFDGLIDIVYIVLGIAYASGLPFDEGFRRVHEANMQKVRGIGARGHNFDVIKPEGWVKPTLEDLVKGE